DGRRRGPVRVGQRDQPGCRRRTRNEPSPCVRAGVREGVGRVPRRDVRRGGMTYAPTTMRRHGSIEPSGRGVVLSALSPAFKYGRSIFPSRVYDPDEVARVLKSGHQSRKIGAFVAKGPRRGWPIYTLTLEERATCPRNCREWA